MRIINRVVVRNHQKRAINIKPDEQKTAKKFEVFQKKSWKSINNYQNFDFKKVILILFTTFSFNAKTIALNFNEANETRQTSTAVDGNMLGIKREDILNEKFLFSNQTTQNTEIEAEIEEIEDDEFRYRAWKNSQVGLTVGGSAISMWFAYKGLKIWEKWMKDQEQKDIEEEIEMTGTYINPGAGNVETSIDPITGKKIELKPSKEKEENNKKPEEK